MDRRRAFSRPACLRCALTDAADVEEKLREALSGVDAFGPQWKTFELQAEVWLLVEAKAAELVASVRLELPPACIRTSAMSAAATCCWLARVGIRSTILRATDAFAEAGM